MSTFQEYDVCNKLFLISMENLGVKRVTPLPYFFVGLLAFPLSWAVERQNS